MSKDHIYFKVALRPITLRHYKVALLQITQGDIQSIEQKILSAKV